MPSVREISMSDLTTLSLSIKNMMLAAEAYQQKEREIRTLRSEIEQLYGMVEAAEKRLAEAIESHNVDGKGEAAVRAAEALRDLVPTMSILGKS